MPLDPLPVKAVIKSDEETKPILSGYSAKLAKLTIELIELIKQETRFLRNRQPREAQRLHGTKSRLMAEYKDTLNYLQVNEKLLGPKDSNIRKYIKKLTDSLRETLRDHARIVLRLKAVAEGIIKSVGEEVVKRDRPVISYGSNASYKSLNVSKPTSLQINEVI